MPNCLCKNCGGQYSWHWIEAFDKFGFNDGDGQIETSQVVVALENHGYEVASDHWGFHNIVISSIMKNGIELIPYEHPDYEFGYDAPRKYLPVELITLLDNEFPSE